MVWPDTVLQNGDSLVRIVQFVKCITYRFCGARSASLLEKEGEVPAKDRIASNVDRISSFQRIILDLQSI
jgi:hypothetical protein